MFVMIKINGVPFWNSDVPPVDMARLKEVERLLGIALPEGYVQLLQEHNGGGTNWFRCWPDNSIGGSPEHDPVIVDLKGAYDEEGSSMSLTAMPYLREEWHMPEDIYLFSGGPQHGLFFDYRAGPNATIGFYCSDLEQDVAVAKSFDSLCESLTHEPFIP